MTGKRTDFLKAISVLAVSAIALSGATTGALATEVFELPLTVTNGETVSRAYWPLAEETMMDADFKVLGLWVHGPGLIHSKTPITKVSDLNGVKLRAPTRVTNMLFKSLGARL